MRTIKNFILRFLFIMLIVMTWGEAALAASPESAIEDTEVEYDWRHDRYLVYTTVGGQRIGYAMPMSRKEYLNYTERTLRSAYFKNLYNKERDIEEGKPELDLLDMQFSLGPAEKIFGKGGIRVRTNGDASLSMGMKRHKIDNPTLSERARDQKSFDFDMQLKLSMNAQVGEKMRFNLNYNTQAAFDFNANKFKLAYEGDEDEIIQLLEAGNVSMSTGNSLISGGQSLFGVKTQLKFGKLDVTALLAKQESKSKTVSSKGGATKRPFEIQADQYDENRHFFLSHYFRNTYDQNMSHLPLISTGVEITKVEVWVTNKQGQYDQARNIVAFMDLAESSVIGNAHWQSQSSKPSPENRNNSLYEEITTQYAGIRDISHVTTELAPLEAMGISGGRDFEKVESARLLSPSEYTVNKALGYISLKQRLDDDVTLAVAFEYTMGGQTYQVGEFSTDGSSSSQTLVVKLLKGTAGNPQLPLWHLMMKNIYSLGVTSLQETDFSLNIQFMSDTVGIYTNFIAEGPIAQQQLIQVMNLDRLNGAKESYPDGRFDFVPGYTVNTQTGRIIFPVIEPFGSHLARKLGNEALARKYCYQELYDSTLTVAQQIADKNKFRLKGEYVASTGAEISLGATNVARGSVVVTAGGTTLTENSDYIVDYNMGVVTILNQSIIESGTPVQVKLEDQELYAMQRKTMMGLDLQYNFSKDIVVGATLLNLHEKPLTKKVSNAEIPINNTMYGVNFKWNKDFMWLTNMVGSIPWVDATAPSNLAIQGEFAQLVAGHNDQIGQAGNVYIDDFEQSETSSDYSSPSQWQLASTPFDDGANALFPEAALSNDIRYGQNRALLAWYSIDRMFTSRSSNLTPGHIKSDVEQLSDHRVRQVNYDEIYPNKQLAYGETGILDVLNLTFYPTERGPYNLDAEGMDENGRLSHPEKRWGGIMRKTDVTNFENANYEYIEFWLMDPFVSGDNPGGDLYFNLGEVSEDILKDGMKSFENGLDADGDTLGTTTTVWGRVSRRTSTVYAFDNNADSRKYQDVGLNGLSSEAEKQFATYRNYVEKVSSKVNGTTLTQWQRDPFSPLNDPAADDYHYYRSSEYDDREVSILERYKHFNGTEGNSPNANDSGEKYSTAAKSTPDVEDINLDNTLNEYERYYQYHVSLRPEDMQVGRNHIESISETTVPLRNGKRETVRWYQFRIPIREYQKRVGNIQNFKSIRFMRMFMTGWQQEQTLRFATLEMVRSNWRNYTASRLTDRGHAVSGTGRLATSTVNIEENAGSYPVNYVLPPGVDRIVDPGQSTATQLNEQAMLLSVENLEPHDALAVYKNSGVDLRQYKRLQLFVHGEALIGNESQLADGDLTLFIRLGADYKDNYYEYEVPIRLTPAGSYNNNSTADRLKVWPKENMIDLDLKQLTRLKKERNSQKQMAGSQVSYTTLFRQSDPDNPHNHMSLLGNPTLSEVGVIMIGVRNTGKSNKSGKVWVNELRTNGIDEGGGWAAKGNATLRVSDIATIHAAGSYASVGWGNIEQSAANRSLSEDWEYSVSGQTDLGRWLPKQLKLKAPFYYSRSKSVSTPKYDPYNEDMLIEETLETYHTSQQKDSIRDLTQTVDLSRSFSLTGVKFDVQSKRPMPWDPANFTLSYSQNLRTSHDPATLYEHAKNYKGALNYQWTPFFKPITFGQNKKNSAKNKSLVLTGQVNWLPNSISMSSNINRTYHEEQLRNIEAQGTEHTIPLSYSKTFTWLRQTAISWDLTRSLKLNFNSATNARIDEPNDPVNKKLYPDEFEAWRDTIVKQIWTLGTPVDYNQTFDATWNLPLAKMKATKWVTASLKYKSNYQWNRGTRIDQHTEMGGTIQNQANWQADVRMNFSTLYNLSKSLRKKNNNKVSWARVLMMARSAQISYKQTNDTYLPSWVNNAGDFFGQSGSGNNMAPGLGFAFGFKGGKDFTQHAIDKGWVACSDSLTTPAVYNLTRDMNYQAVLEPLPGLKINLTGSWRRNDKESHQFMFADMPMQRSGTLQMTTVALRSSFGGTRQKNKYSSRAFDELLQNRDIIYKRILSRYEGTRYAEGGFMRQLPQYAGMPFKKELGQSRLNSSDVLVPAFLAAYTGQKAEKIALTPFPSMWRALPNWRITYDGLLKLFPRLASKFKTLTLSHTYNCTYSVGSYNSFNNYAENADGLCFVLDAQNNVPVPSSQFDISTVTLTESFAPLLGINATTHGGITARVEYKQTRTESLNMTAVQLVENISRDLSVGTGYKVVDFGQKMGWTNAQSSAKNKGKKVSHDLNVKLDVTYRKQTALLRKIASAYTEATSGNKAWNIRLNADYQFSKMLTMKLYWQKQINTPLISTSYPTVNTDFGITASLSLVR